MRSSTANDLTSVPRTHGTGPSRAGWVTAAGAAASALGVWLLAAPFVFPYGPAARWNGIFVGTLIVAFGALLGLLGLRSGELSGLLGLLGGWLLVAPFLLSYGTVAAWSGHVTGAILVVLGLSASPAAGNRLRR